MNWEAIGAVGELLGSLAVLLTLIYLALQVRHSKELLEENRKIALSRVYWDRTQSRLQFGWETAAPGEIVEILLKLRDEDGKARPIDERFSVLTPAEKAKLAANRQNILLHQDNNLYKNELGLVDDEILEITTKTILDMMPVWKALDIPIPKRVADWHEKQMRSADT